MKVYVLGGFLGAGKTTLIRALARHLKSQGEQVAVVTNDQGRALVDTQLCERDAEDVQEITGGCFCCRYDDLEGALLAAQKKGATVAVAEAVGSCTDLVATVLSPLADRRPRLELQPLGIVVDPWRVRQVESGGMPDDVAYLFRKQIQEADVILVSRADLAPPDVTEVIASLAPGAAVVGVSGRTGEGVVDWLDARPTKPAAPLAIDYRRYADAEALLGWANATVEVSSAAPFAPTTLMHGFLARLSEAPVAHVKVSSESPRGANASIVRAGAEPVLESVVELDDVTSARFLVNARVALAPEELDRLLRSAMTDAAAGADVVWSDWACFQPAPPQPTHRHAFRRGTGDDASCCAAFYDRAEVRYLLGDSLHPGGVRLTLRVAERLGLTEESSLLDVACGRGTSLKAIAQAWPIRSFGLDAGLPEEVGRPNGLTVSGGDAHDIPYPDTNFDALLCECALSTFADPEVALAEMRRVLRPGGRLGLSDMVVEGTVPEELRDWVHVGTCLAGARTLEGYRETLEANGFRVIEHWNAADGLHEVISRIKRNLLGLALARATGNLPDDVDIDVQEGRALLKQAARAVEAGVIGYGVYIAERAD